MLTSKRRELLRHVSALTPIKHLISSPHAFVFVTKSAPIGLAVLTILVVLSAGYTVWNDLPSERALAVEKVPPAPGRQSALPSAVSQTSTPTALVPAPPAAFAAALQDRRITSGSPSSEVLPETGKENITPETPVGVFASVPMPVATAVPTISPAQADQPTVQAKPTARSSTERAASAPPTEKAITRPPALGSTPKKPVNVDTQVSVRANSWVELQAPNGDVLAHTYVRAGESYMVPAGIAYRVIAVR